MEIRILEELTEAKLKTRFVGKKGRHHILTTPSAFSETNNEFLERTGKAVEIIRKAAEGT